MALREERLNEDKHFIIVGDFCCGADDPLNNFLSSDSFEYDKRYLGHTYLLFDEDELLAFYTIKANGLQTFDADANEFNAIPVIEIARIAVENELQNNGVGKVLFHKYIMEKVKKVQELIAVKAIIVFVEKDNIKGIKFYESVGFKRADKNVQRYIDESFNEECLLYILTL